jgi:hypothetical protein
MFLRFVSGAHLAQPRYCTTTAPAIVLQSTHDCRVDGGEQTSAFPGCGMPVILVLLYHYTLVPNISVITMTVQPKRIEIERVQTGVRMERRILKVLKALAEYKNITLGDLLEGIVLHAFEGKAPFAAETVRKIAELKNIYELDLDARASHRLKEKH